MSLARSRPVDTASPTGLAQSPHSSTLPLPTPGNGNGNGHANTEASLGTSPSIQSSSPYSTSRPRRLSSTSIKQRRPSYSHSSYSATSYLESVYGEQHRSSSANASSTGLSKGKGRARSRSLSKAQTILGGSNFPSNNTNANTNGNSNTRGATGMSFSRYESLLGKSLPATTSTTTTRSASQSKRTATGPSVQQGGTDSDDGETVIEGDTLPEDGDDGEDDDGLDLDLDESAPGFKRPKKLASNGLAAHGSAGGKKKKETLLRCERCNKVYHHPQSLIKHRWQHTEIWSSASSYGLSKHQTVQALEAAVILATNPTETVNLLPEDKSHWPAAISPPTSGLLGSENVNLDVLSRYSKSVPASGYGVGRIGSSLGAIMQEMEEDDDDDIMSERNNGMDDNDAEDEDDTDSADDLLPIMEEDAAPRSTGGDLYSASSHATPLLSPPFSTSAQRDSALRSQREDTAFQNMDSGMHAMDLNYNRPASLSPYLNERSLPAVSSPAIAKTSTLPPLLPYSRLPRNSNTPSLAKSEDKSGESGPKRQDRETSAVSTDDGTLSGSTSTGVSGASATNLTNPSSGKHGTGHSTNGGSSGEEGTSTAFGSSMKDSGYGSTTLAAARNGLASGTQPMSVGQPRKDNASIQPQKSSAGLSAPVLGFFTEESKSPTASVIISPHGSIAASHSSASAFLQSPTPSSHGRNGAHHPLSGSFKRESPLVAGESRDGEAGGAKYTPAETEAAEILSSSYSSSPSAHHPSPALKAQRIRSSPIIRPTVHPYSGNSFTAAGRSFSTFAGLGSPQLPSNYLSQSHHSPALGPHLTNNGLRNAATSPSFGSPNFPASFGQAPISYRATSVSRSFSQTPSGGNKNLPLASVESPSWNNTRPLPSPLPPTNNGNQQTSEASVVEEDDDLMDMDL